MTNPYRSRREREAFEAGRASALSEKQDEDTPPLTRSLVEAMTPQQVTQRWPEVQAALRNGFAEEDE